MALIKCSECSKDVSKNATSCPYCGNPLKETTVKVSTEKNKPIEVELTNKKWKKVILVAWIGILATFLLWSISNYKNYAWLGLTIIFVIVLIVGKIGAWYSNR